MGGSDWDVLKFCVVWPLVWPGLARFRLGPWLGSVWLGLAWFLFGLYRFLQFRPGLPARIRPESVVSDFYSQFNIERTTWGLPWAPGASRPDSGLGLSDAISMNQSINPSISQWDRPPISQASDQGMHRCRRQFARALWASRENLSEPDQARKYVS